MNKFNNTLLSISLISLFGVTGCGGGGGGGGESNSSNQPPIITKTVSFSGLAADGYISGATACLDLNSNGTCESAEPTTLTALDGTFSFTNIEVKKNQLLPVIIVAGPNAIDTATGKAFTGSLKNIIDSDTLNAGVPLNVTPLTDLMATSFLQSNTKDTTALNSSKSEIAQAFNLTLTDITADPMKDTKVFAKTQELEQIKSLIKKTASKAKGGTFTQEQELALQSDINDALVAQTKESTGVVDVNKVLTKLETITTLSIPANEKKFVTAQAKEVQRALQSIPSDIDINKLDELQAGLETEQELALQKIEDATEVDTIAVVAISDVDKLIAKNQTPKITAPTVAANSGFPTPPTTPTY